MIKGLDSHFLIPVAGGNELRNAELERYLSWELEHEVSKTILNEC